MPTQSEIDLDKSLKHALINKESFKKTKAIYISSIGGEK